jgi:hypothetical protein
MGPPRDPADRGGARIAPNTMIEDDIEDASVRAGAALRPFGCPRELETDRIIFYD